MANGDTWWYNERMNKESGQISRALLILAVVILVAAAAIYFYLKFVNGQQLAKQQKAQQQAQQEPLKPVYEARVGDVNFTFKTARNLGKVLKGPSSSGFSKTITSTEGFIQVVLGAQNKGKVESVLGSWAVGSLIDSEGRVFRPVDTKAYFLLPQPNLCGTALKPEFDPTPCMRIYEVSSEAKGLKIQVSAATKAGSSKKQTVLLDLDIK